MASIDYYLGTISPYVYLAGTRLEEIAEKHGATVTYKPLDLLQLFDRTGGIRPAERHPSRYADSQSARAQSGSRSVRFLT